MRDFYWKFLQNAHYPRGFFRLMHPNGLDAIGHMYALPGKYEACPYGGAPIQPFNDPYQARAYLEAKGKLEDVKGAAQ